MKKATLAAIAASLATLLVACGQQQEGQTPPPAPAPAEAAAPAPQSNAVAEAAAPAANAEGEKLFKQTCSLCHATGAAGAPIAGNKEDWAPRIAQGTDMLYKHALEGFTGAKGVMPAKGGDPNLADEAVKAAVDYMVAKSQ